MNISPIIKIEDFWSNLLTGYLNNPWNVITLIIDVTIVIFLIVKAVKVLKGSRAMQLVNGMIFLILITWASYMLNLRILNYILTTIMTYGVILLIVLFQPELRRALEQLGINTASIPATTGAEQIKTLISDVKVDNLEEFLEQLGIQSDFPLGKGISKIIRDNCDYIATIPMSGKINSLNASVSCGIILSHIVGDR